MLPSNPRGIKPEQKLPSVVAGLVAGAIVTLILGGAGLYVFFGRSDADSAQPTARADATAADVPAPDAAAAPTSTVAKAPAEATSPSAPVARIARKPPAAGSNEEPAPALPTARSNLPSVLGSAGSVDRLAAPAALPPGMLRFLRGLDQLGAFRPLDAVASFGQAIAANEENSDYYAARGAALVVAEQMEQSLPDLQRAMKLNPQNVLASRLTRLAYLMLGDQLKASKFHGHGSTQNVDFLFTEVGNGYGSRAIARKHGFAQSPQDQQKSAAALQKLSTVASLVANSFQTGDDKSAQALFRAGGRADRRQRLRGGAAELRSRACQGSPRLDQPLLSRPQRASDRRSGIGARRADVPIVLGSLFA